MTTTRRAMLLAAGLAAAALLGACTTGERAGPGAAQPVPPPAGAAAPRPPADTGGTAGTGDPAGKAGTPGKAATAGSGGTAGTGGTAGKRTEGSGGRPVAVPAAVMLRPSDWLHGEVRVARTGVAGLPQTEPSACQDRTAFPSDRHRLAARVVGITSDAPESGGVQQVVVRYAAGWGPAAMAEMRRVLAACHSFERTYPRGVPTQVRYVLEAEHFAGDDALLVRVSERLRGETRDWWDYLTVVRLGDALVTTTHSVGEGVAYRDLAVRLATAGARRAACLRTTTC